MFRSGVIYPDCSASAVGSQLSTLNSRASVLSCHLSERLVPIATVDFTVYYHLFTQSRLGASPLARSSCTALWGIYPGPAYVWVSGSGLFRDSSCVQFAYIPFIHPYSYFETRSSTQRGVCSYIHMSVSQPTHILDLRSKRTQRRNGRPHTK